VQNAEAFGVGGKNFLHACQILVFKATFGWYYLRRLMVADRKFGEPIAPAG
jgi:hypothetical protein